TNVAQRTIAEAQVTLSGLANPGRQRFDLRGTVTVPTLPPVDPIAHGMRVIIGEAGGPVLVDAIVPPGPFAPDPGQGWRARGGGWEYRAHGGVAGIRLLRMVPVEAATGTYEVSLHGRK